MQNPRSSHLPVTGIQQVLSLMFTLFLLLSIQCKPILAQPNPDKSKKPAAYSKLWVSAYLASWNHFAPPGGNWGDLPTSAIDWNAFTQLIYFALPVMPGGLLKEIKPYENVNPDRVLAITTAARHNGKPVLISIGGWGNYDNFHQAISSEYRAEFIKNLIQLITYWHFDGIDLDMEPIQNDDVNDFTVFVKELSAALNQITLSNGKKPILTVATKWQPKMFAKLYPYFDQVNLMTYDLSGAWRGWVSWYNSAIYDAGHTFPGTNRPLPSVNQMVTDFIDAGVPADKVGIGIDFYGYVWNGVSRPNKGWTFIAPKVTDNVPYSTIMNEYFQPDRYRWDQKAKSSYLSINNHNDKLFITYDGRQTVKAKVRYAREKKLGGVFLWEIGASYFKSAPVGKQDSLMKVVKSSVYMYPSQ
ncbi:MAG TPA: glycoside hydrolase family 18 protein [Balneolales bacterium]|nr:glycoside hydrolase family 18 protein [Balneolales bacterium]